MQTHCKQTTDYQDKVIKELEAAPANGYHPWTEFEEAMLKKYYGKKDIKVIAKALNKTIGAINRKASIMRLSYKR